uniref:Uncharacterized protein n=1 Tax=Panagrolaimus davidi TaxID=227884 RepID=A0A914PFB4_9BILA
MEGPSRRNGFSDERDSNLSDEDHVRFGKERICSRLNEDKPVKQPKGVGLVKGNTINAGANSKGGASQIVDCPQQSEGDIYRKVPKNGTPKLVDFPQQYKADKYTKASVGERW